MLTITLIAPYERAAALVNEMTIEEKYNNTMFYLSSEDSLGLPQFNVGSVSLFLVHPD